MNKSLINDNSVNIQSSSYQQNVRKQYQEDFSQLTLREFNNKRNDPQYEVIDFQDETNFQQQMNNNNTSNILSQHNSYQFFNSPKKQGDNYITDSIQQSQEFNNNQSIQNNLNNSQQSNKNNLKNQYNSIQNGQKSSQFYQKNHESIKHKNTLQLPSTTQVQKARQTVQNLRQQKEKEQQNVNNSQNLSISINPLEQNKKLRLRIQTVMKNVMHRCQFWRYQNLTERHLNIIGDLSYFQKQNYKSKHALKQVFSNNAITKYCDFNYLDQHIPIFKPESKFSIIVTIICAACILIQCYIYTFHIFFAFGFQDYPQVLRLIFLGVYVLDTLFFLNLGFYQKGTLVSEHRKIFKNYHNSQFYFDICGYFTITYNFFDSSNSYTTYFLEFPFFFKLFQFKYKVDAIEKIFVNSGARSNLYNFFKLIFNITSLGHIVAIFWHLLGQLELNILEEENTWLHAENAINAEWYERYQHAFYWALSTMMLIGSKGNNFLESVFTCLTVLTTVGVFAYTITEIANIIDNINRDSIIYKNELAIVNQYMKSKKTPIYLQSQVRNYLEFLHMYSNSDMKKEADPVLNKLPSNLQKELFQEINLQLIQEFPQLQKMFSSQALDQIIQADVMEEKLYLNEEVIFKQDQYEDISIYLIFQGSVNVFFLNENEKGIYDKSIKEIKIKCLNQGEIFGTFGQQHKFTAKCAQACTIYKIPKEKIEKIVRQNQDDLEKYKQIKDKLFLGRGIERLMNQKCMICQQVTHSETNCPMVRFLPTTNSILRLNYSKEQIQRNHICKSVFKRSEQGLNEYLKIVKNIDNKQFKVYEQDIYKKCILREKQRQNRSTNRINNRTITQTPLNVSKILDNQSNNLNKQELNNINSFKNIPIQSNEEVLISPRYQNKQILEHKIFIQRSEQHQKYSSYKEFDDLNAFSIVFQAQLEKQISHFLHNEVYQSKTYQQWLDNFLKYDKINDGQRDYDDDINENETDNWYMIWLDKHLEELQVYCEDFNDELQISALQEVGLLNQQKMRLGVIQEQDDINYNDNETSSMSIDEQESMHIQSGDDIKNSKLKKKMSLKLKTKYSNGGNEDLELKSPILNSNKTISIQQQQSKMQNELLQKLNQQIKNKSQKYLGSRSSTSMPQNELQQLGYLNQMQVLNQQQEEQFKKFTTKQDYNIMQQSRQPQNNFQRKSVTQNSLINLKNQSTKQKTESITSFLSNQINFQISNQSQNNFSNNSSYNEMRNKQISLGINGKLQKYLKKKPNNSASNKLKNKVSQIVDTNKISQLLFKNKKQNDGSIGNSGKMHSSQSLNSNSKEILNMDSSDHESDYEDTIVYETGNQKLSEKQNLFFEFDITKEFKIYFQQFNFSYLTNQVKRVKDKQIQQQKIINQQQLASKKLRESSVQKQKAIQNTCKAVNAFKSN